jgi:acyl carrier protein
VFAASADETSDGTQVMMMDIPHSFRKALLSHLPYATGEDLVATDDLAALGLDSMGVVRLLTDLEETFSLELPDELITEDTFATVGSLWQTVAGLIAPGQLADA